MLCIIQRTIMKSVWTKRYMISGFWKQRMRRLILNYLPHTIHIVESYSNGGLRCFIEAAKKKRGEPFKIHRARISRFNDAIIYNTFEAMCYACMVDAQGDMEIERMQGFLRYTIEKWLNIILDAQLDDGYLQTYIYLNDYQRWLERGGNCPEDRHEGYVAGYFLEAAIAHFLLFEGQDLRLYKAAKKLADLYSESIGHPPKISFIPDHPGLEQSLIRFAELVGEIDGGSAHLSYIALVDYFLSARSRTQSGGNAHIQKKELPADMTEIYGHAVMAVYLASGMAAIANHPVGEDFIQASLRLWEDIVNKKMYLTGGVGSSYDGENFEIAYVLPNKGYAETCASCGMIFFAHNLGLFDPKAKYFDILERVLYNAVLGSVNLDGSGWLYQNPLESSGKRNAWMKGLCCMNNMTRTIFQIPTWMLMVNQDQVYINLYIGGTFSIDNFQGGRINITQITEYPWRGDVKIIIEPECQSSFKINIRIPDRNDSVLYKRQGMPGDAIDVKVNSKTCKTQIINGYMQIDRDWQAGDEIGFTIPMTPVFVTADEKIIDCRGKIALEFGPLVYNFEHVDNFIPYLDELEIDSAAPLSIQWCDMLEGIMLIKTPGPIEDHLAIPNYARNNRDGESTVFVKSIKTDHRVFSIEI